MNREILIVLTIILISCRIEPPDLPEENRLYVPDLKREIFVLNSLGESLSVINPEYAGENLPSGELPPFEYTDNGLTFSTEIKDLYNGETGNGIVAVGQWPNQIIGIGNSLYIVESGGNTISVRDESTFRITGTIDLPSGCNPYYLYPDPDNTGTAYVSGFLNNTLYVLNLADNTITAEISLNTDSGTVPGRGPEGIACADGYIFVACTNWNTDLYGYKQGAVIVIDSETNEVVSRINIETDEINRLFEEDPDFCWGCNPQSILPFPELHEIHIICTGTMGTELGGENYKSSDDGEIIVMDTQDFFIKTRLQIGGSPLGSVQGIDFDKHIVYLSGTDGIRAYSYSPSLSIIFGQGGESPLLSEESGYYPAIVLDSVNNKIFISSFNSDTIRILRVPEVLTDPFIELKTLSVPDGPISLYLSEE